MNPTIHPIVLFDGVCAVCQGSVKFILKRDPNGIFHFAPLQSEVGRGLLEKFGLPEGGMNTMVLVEGERCFTRSSAALKIARRLRFPWPLFSVFFLVPSFLRDFVYNFVAKRRYDWFGKREECLLPSPKWKGRFLG
ncbi:MAG: thiol-disulfide oxidoreductase DCC family protein [bacterium]